MNNKTKKQLIDELIEMRQRVAELQAKEIELKRSEEQILLPNERLRYLLSSTSAVIYIAKTSGDYGATFVSENVNRMVGYEPRNFIENSSFWLDHVHPEDKQRILAELPQIFEQKYHTYEYRFLCKNGTYIWVRDEMKLVLDKEGKPLEIIGYWIDISGRKQAEEKLCESEKKYRTLVERSLQGIVIAQEDPLRLVFVNQAMSDILGYTTNELTLLLTREIEGLVHIEDRSVFFQRFRDRLEGKAVPPHYEIRGIRKDGIVRWLEIYASSIEYQGRPAVQAAFVDITERKQAEQALKEREKELEMKTKNLEEANTALKVFLKRRDEDKTEIEERILLNMKERVIPYLEKLKKSGLDEKQKIYVGILESNLNDVISPFSQRLSSMYLNLTPTEIQIANLLRQGKTNKEIGELLHSSPRTIAFHRENIRKKLGLKNKKTNLKTYLLSLT
jgi:PAS domain S-box-containing protein